MKANMPPRVKGAIYHMKIEEAIWNQWFGKNINQLIFAIEEINL